MHAKSLRRFISTLTLVAFTACSLVLPGGQALAAARTMQFTTGPYTVHTLDWESLGAMPAENASKSDSDNGSGSYVLAVRIGMNEQLVGAQRGGARRFRRLDALARYVKSLGLKNFDVDVADWDPSGLL